MIQVELNGLLTEVSKHQLFALAKRGQIGPETRIVVNGRESKARKVNGIEFGEKSVAEPPAGQDLIAQYKQKFYGNAQESPKRHIPVPPPTEYEQALYEQEQKEIERQDQALAMSAMPYTPPPDKYCIACGTPLVAFAAFCSSCGTPSNPAGVQQSGLHEGALPHYVAGDVPGLEVPKHGIAFYLIAVLLPFIGAVAGWMFIGVFFFLLIGKDTFFYLYDLSPLIPLSIYILFTFAVAFGPELLSRFLNIDRSKTYRGGFCLYLFMMFISVIVIAITVPSDSNAPVRQKNDPANAQAGTLDAYNRIKNGMSYREVVAIVGEPTSEDVDSLFEGIRTTSYTWEVNDTLGANFSVMIQNGKVIMKSQAGLRK